MHFLRYVTAAKYSQTTQHRRSGHSQFELKLDEGGAVQVTSQAHTAALSN